jgi:hypothetical protein
MKRRGEVRRRGGEREDEDQDVGSEMPRERAKRGDGIEALFSSVGRGGEGRGGQGREHH